VKRYRIKRGGRVWAGDHCYTWPAAGDPAALADAVFVETAEEPSNNRNLVLLGPLGRAYVAPGDVEEVKP